MDGWMYVTYDNARSQKTRRLVDVEIRNKGKKLK